MRERYGARLYMFGSRAQGAARPESDYDLVAVAESFEQHPLLARVPERRRLWQEVGGWGLGLDLHCYTPREFREETRDEFGYLGQAKSRGELLPVRGKRRMPRALQRAPS
jgi:predicted nucleotidyltransferase